MKKKRIIDCGWNYGKGREKIEKIKDYLRIVMNGQKLREKSKTRNMN